VLTEVEDAPPQVGIVISLERSSGRSRGVRDNKLSSEMLNDDVNDVFRSLFVDESYILLSSSMDTERGVVKSLLEVDPGCSIGGVDSGRLDGIPFEDDANLEKNFFIGKPGAGV
jgi:hypothetical protein